MTSSTAYQQYRPLMFSIAYRMLGSVTEAEDVLQEAFLRYHRAVAGGLFARPGQSGPGMSRQLRVIHSWFNLRRRWHGSENR